MKRAENQSQTFTLLATALLLIAIPISVVGVQQVNDIRNEAAEETPLVSFATDFSSDAITHAYTAIPYQQHINLSGTLSLTALLRLGCDETHCGDLCEGTQNSPPDGFLLGDDNRTLIWDDPVKGEDDATSWPITLSAVALADETTGEYICSVASYTLSLSDASENRPPICTLHAVSGLSSVPQNRVVPLILQGSDYDNGIVAAQVISQVNGETEEDLAWTFDDPLDTIALNKDSDPSLTITPDTDGVYTISATVTDADGLSTECSLPTGSQINVVIPGDNGSPVFDTDPYTASRPGTDITTGTAYTYTVEAHDPNNDAIDYFIINNTGWLTFTLNENSHDGFQGTFSGTPTAPGSYTVITALNDGYHNHYSTQIWVINVDSPTNDVPHVQITLPPAGSTIQQRENVKIQWVATDSNLITDFNVYIATDPSNQSTWRTVSSGLAYNYDSYIWNAGITSVGTYYFIVEATDNQTPPATGTGISGPIGIGVAPNQEPTTPGDDVPNIVDSYPTITNLTPADKSDIDDGQPLISATMTASDEHTIVSSSVSMTLDDEDITAIATLRGDGRHDGSILFTPSQPLARGSHKVTLTFEDSSDQTATKTWTFTIDATPDEERSENTDTITIFGFDIPRRIAMILGIGLVLVLLALAIPWLFYAAWRRSKDEADDDTDSREFTLPQDPLLPTSNTPEPTHIEPIVPMSNSSFSHGVMEPVSGIAVQPRTTTEEPPETIPTAAPAEESTVESPPTTDPAVLGAEPQPIMDAPSVEAPTPDIQPAPPITSDISPEETSTPATVTETTMDTGPEIADTKHPTTWAEKVKGESPEAEETNTTTSAHDAAPASTPSADTPDNVSEEEILKAFKQIAQEEKSNRTATPPLEPKLQEQLPDKPNLLPEDAGPTSDDASPDSKPTNSSSLVPPIVP